MGAMSDETKDTLRQLIQGPNYNEVLIGTNQIHLINHYALVIALMSKGIITQKEYQACLAKATHFIDQQWKEKMDERQAENDKKLDKLEEELPIIGKLLAQMARRQRDADGEGA